MKNTINCILSACAVAFTVWFMHFGEITTIEGALSKSGIIHPVYFAIWGVLTFSALYCNIFSLYRKNLSKNVLKRFTVPLSAVASVGMAITLTCRFDKIYGFEYYLHCAGSLAFSIITSVVVFTYYLLNFKKHIFYGASTIIIGVLLITDLIFLIIYKQNALIEAIPILFALIIMPVTLLFIKDKNYASQKA